MWLLDIADFLEMEAPLTANHVSIQDLSGKTQVSTSKRGSKDGHDYLGNV